MDPKKVEDVPCHDFRPALEKVLPGPLSPDGLSAAEFEPGNPTARAAAPGINTGSKLWDGLTKPDLDQV
jgi:hypothetical protein